MTPGQRVILITPDNATFHRRIATVAEVTEWGANVLTDASPLGRFRALHNEMMPCTGDPTPQEMGYTGDPCAICGCLTVKRTGPCVTCETCGHNSGC